MGEIVRESKRFRATGKNRPREDRGDDSLLLMAVPDYDSRDTAALLDFARHLTPPADLLLYGGGAAHRPRTVSIDQLKSLAAATKYGVCAIAGKPLTFSRAIRKKPATIRDAALSAGGLVHDVHRSPILVGNYAVIGGGICEGGNSRGQRTDGLEARINIKWLRSATSAVAGHYIVLLTKVPTAFANRQRSRCQCSDELREFVHRRKNVSLVVTDCAGYGGLEYQKLGRSLVVNVASHSAPGQPGRVGLIDMRHGKVANLAWRTLWDLASIPGINEERKSLLSKAGIRTLRDLVDSSNESIACVLKVSDSETSRLRAFALAFLCHDIVVLQSFSLPNSDRAYLTVEKCGVRDDIRLVGVHFENENATNIFLAETPEEEGDILARFLRLVGSTSKRNLICFSGSLWQQQLLSRRLARHRLPTQITRSIKNIYFDIKDCLVFPTRRLALRDIAECCGFRWPNSMDDGYGAAQLCNTSERLTKMQKRALARHCEKDLLALRHVVVHLESMLADKVRPSI